MAAPINIGMPFSLDVGPTYTLRVTAIDPTTGNVTANVNVGAVVIEAEGTGNLSTGDWVAGVSQLLVTQAQGPGTNP